MDTKYIKGNMLIKKMNASNSGTIADTDYSLGMTFNNQSVTDLLQSLGLGQVDNTSDVEKPISKAVSDALALKADKTELNNYVKKSDLSDTGVDVDLSEYAKLTDLNKYAQKIDLRNVITKEDLKNVKPEIDLTEYALKSEIPSLEGYAKTEDIPDVSNFLTEHQDISNLATKDDLKGLRPTVDLSEYAKTSEVDEKIAQIKLDATGSLNFNEPDENGLIIVNV